MPPIHALDVVLTDLLITGLALYFAFQLLAQSSTHAELRSLFVGLFLSSGLAALAGAIYHGFYQHNPELLYAAEFTPLLEMTILLILGLTSYYIWRLFIFFALSQRIRGPALVLLFIMLTAYFVVVLVGVKGFKMAVAAYLPPAILLMLTFAVKWIARKDARYFLGLMGLLVTLAAAGVQVSKVTIHPEYFTHNALYHVVQGVGLYLIFKFAQRIMSWQQ